MRWEDERYVRLYIRDTLTWRSLGWEARAVFPLLLRKVDRAGILDVGDDPVAAIALVADLPPEFVRAALPALLASGSVVHAGTSICIPHFIEAQEAVASSAARKRKSRETARAVKAANSKQIPLRGHEPGHGGVTPYCTEPSRAVPSLAEPKKEPAAQKPAATTSSTKLPAPLPEPPSDHHALVAYGVQVIEAATGVGYGFRDEDGNQVKGLLKRFTLEEAKAVFDLAAERYAADAWHKKRGLTFRLIANDANTLRTAWGNGRVRGPLPSAVQKPQWEQRGFASEQAYRDFLLSLPDPDAMPRGLITGGRP